MAVTARKLKRSAGQAVSRNGHRGQLRQLVIISGMSGSGKKAVINTYEDLGFYCVDNLPVDLIPRFAELARHSADIERTAIVVDVREGEGLEKLPAMLKSVRRLLPTTVIFLEADDAVLLRRYS